MLRNPFAVKLRYDGFSLIEMAMVLLILGLVLNGLFVAMGQSDFNRRRSQTEAQIEQITEALYGFAQINGRLPCPADFDTLGEEDTPAATCGLPWGFVPGRTLDLEGSYNADGLLLDPWGNPYRYSVATRSNGTNAVVTNSTGLRAWFANPASFTSGNWLCIADSVGCGGLVYSDAAPALVFSQGPDWGSTPSALEAENVGGTISTYAVPDDVNFVSTQFSDDATLYFNDQMKWLSTSILISRMIDAGKLP